MTKFLHSYRGRLVIYSIALMIFLSGTLFYSYHHVYSLIKTEAHNHIERVAQLSHSRLEDIRSSLKGYVDIVQDDLRLQEYMYVVTHIGSETKPLQELYKKHFGWFATDRRMIISSKGQTLVGQADNAFLNRIRFLLEKQTDNTAYIETADGLEIVAISPIKYLDSTLGHVILTKLIGQQWLKEHYSDSGVMAFFEQQGTVISSGSGKLNGIEIPVNNDQLSVKDDTFHIRRLNLTGTTTDMPQLWFAIKDTALTSRLDQHRKITLSLIGLGVIAVTLFGLLLIRNFSRPLSQLMCLTREVAAGRLPEVRKTSQTNEIAALANQFSDMVKALKDKQQEIDRVHATLEKSAITDMLTGLYNRRYLQVVFPKLVAQAQRDNNRIAAILIDIDHFKKINDTHGHITGDMCLAQFSDELKKYSRTNDYLFRIGGEEFLILSITEDINGIYQFAEKLRLAIEQTPAEYIGKTIPITISCGISLDDPTDSSETVITHMLSLADKAMYKAKEQGRNRICIAPGQSDTKKLHRV